MRILLTLLFSIISTATLAADKIDILNSYRVGGVNYRAADYIAKNNPEVFNEVTNLGTCLDVVNVLEHTNKPTIAVWDMVDLAVRKDKSCNIVTQKNFITVYATTYYKICAHKDHTKNTLDKLLTQEVRVGFSASTMLVKLYIDNTLKHLNSKAKIVPYKNSGHALAALQAKEIDYVYTGSTKDFSECLITADDASDEMNRFSDYFEGAYATANYSIVFIGVNVDNAAVKTILESTYNNSDWSTVFSGYSSSFGKEPVVHQYNKLINDINTFIEANKK